MAPIVPERKESDGGAPACSRSDSMEVTKLTSAYTVIAPNPRKHMESFGWYSPPCYIHFFSKVMIHVSLL